MNPLERMQIFVRVAELASFTQAADALGLPKATVSTAVQQLEADLGARLLHRTTRRVQPTQDGQAFYERCKDVLADVDELQTMFQQTPQQSLRGRVRMDMSTGLARHAVIPRLPELLDQHPLLEIEISSTERRVDLVREGFDCVIRTGAVGDTTLIARPMGSLTMVNCASPGYLKRYGTPTQLSDLAQHRLIQFSATLGAKPDGFEVAPTHAADPPTMITMPSAITVNNAEAYSAACLAGLGIMQVPLLGGVREMLASGRLVTVLPRHVSAPMPLHLLYVSRRNVSRRVRFVMDWLVQVVQEYNAAAGVDLAN